MKAINFNSNGTKGARCGGNATALLDGLEGGVMRLPVLFSSEIRTGRRGCRVRQSLSSSRAKVT